MRVVISIEIDTDDYKSKKFAKRIDKLITGVVGELMSDVNEDAKLIRYEMYKKKELWNWGSMELG